MYYYKSEKEAAYWAMKKLEGRLPDYPMAATDCHEWGTIIFRWDDDVEGGHKYAFQKPYESETPDGFWNPRRAGVPSYAEEWAYVHTHPNDAYFSTTDTKTARWLKVVFYMVNRKGMYWYDGRTADMSPSARHGQMLKN